MSTKITSTKIMSNTDNADTQSNETIASSQRKFASIDGVIEAIDSIEANEMKSSDAKIMFTKFTSTKIASNTDNATSSTPSFCMTASNYVDTQSNKTIIASLKRKFDSFEVVVGAIDSIEAKAEQNSNKSNRDAIFKKADATGAYATEAPAKKKIKISIRYSSSSSSSSSYSSSSSNAFNATPRDIYLLNHNTGANTLQIYQDLVQGRLQELAPTLERNKFAFRMRKAYNARSEFTENASTVAYMPDPASSVMGKYVSPRVLSMTTIGLPEQYYELYDVPVSIPWRESNEAYGIYMDSAESWVCTGMLCHAKHLAAHNLSINDSAAAYSTGAFIDVIDVCQDLRNVQICQLQESDWRVHPSNRNSKAYACCTVTSDLIRRSVYANSVLLLDHPLMPVISATGVLGRKQLDSLIAVGLLTEFVLNEDELFQFGVSPLDLNSHQTDTFRASVLFDYDGSFFAFTTNNPATNLCKWGAWTFGQQDLRDNQASHVATTSIQSQLFGGPPVELADTSHALNLAFGVGSEHIASVMGSKAFRDLPGYVCSSVRGGRKGGKASGYQHRTGYRTGQSSKGGTIGGKKDYGPSEDAPNAHRQKNVHKTKDSKLSTKQAKGEGGKSRNTSKHRQPNPKSAVDGKFNTKKRQHNLVRFTSQCTEPTINMNLVLKFKNHMLTAECQECWDAMLDAVKRRADDKKWWEKRTSRGGPSKEEKWLCRHCTTIQQQNIVLWNEQLARRKTKKG